MSDTKITIYIDGTYMIKQEEHPDGTMKFYVKQIWDTDLREEIIYGWSNIKVNSVEEAKELLASK